jgi:hypothetical protein
MAIEIVDFPIKHGDFPSFFVCLPEDIPHQAATATFLSPLAHLRRQGVQLRASLVLFQVPSQHRALGDGRGAEPTLQEPGPGAAVEGGAGADGMGMVMFGGNVRNLGEIESF